MAINASKLQGSAYQLLHKDFTEWLQLLGYSPLSIPSLSGTILHFLSYLEQQGKPELQQLTATDASNYLQQLQQQTGVRTGKPFSPAYLNKQIQSLLLFSRYLRETGRNETGFALPLLPAAKASPAWLTRAEINQLYEAIPDGILGIRDRAMLAVYYGCGLRLNEGANIELKDIGHTRRMLYVRKGKGYRQRWVPIVEKNYEELKLYLDYARPQLLSACSSPPLGELEGAALFIGAQKGVKMGKQSLYLRLKKLVKKAGIAKKVGTHTLRHSIATHLLQSGMRLERIKDFLGHSHLDSTQLYTHLVNDKP